MPKQKLSKRYELGEPITQDVLYNSYSAEDVKEKNAAWMEEVVQATLLQPTQVISVLTIPTPVGSAIVSLTTTRLAPTATTTTYSITMDRELLNTLKVMAYQNAQLPLQNSKVLEDAVKPLLEVHRATAGKSLGSSTNSARTQFLPPYRNSLRQ